MPVSVQSCKENMRSFGLGDAQQSDSTRARPAAVGSAAREAEKQNMLCDFADAEPFPSRGCEVSGPGVPAAAPGPAPFRASRAGWEGQRGFSSAKRGQCLPTAPCQDPPSPRPGDRPGLHPSTWETSAPSHPPPPPAAIAVTRTDRARGLPGPPPPGVARSL